MATTSSTSYSLPLLSIPAYYFLAQLPHVVAVARATRGDMRAHDNRNPRGTANAERARRGLSAAELAGVERAEACHRNALENLALYVGAVVAGVVAERAAGKGAVGLDGFVYGWMALRAAYAVNYLYVAESKGWSLVRTALFNVASGWAVVVLVRAAKVLG